MTYNVEITLNVNYAGQPCFIANYCMKIGYIFIPVGIGYTSVNLYQLEPNFSIITSAPIMRNIIQLSLIIYACMMLLLIQKKRIIS